jgi:hypothetical protein
MESVRGWASASVEVEAIAFLILLADLVHFAATIALACIWWRETTQRTGERRKDHGEASGEDVSR